MPHEKSGIQEEIPENLRVNVGTFGLSYSANLNSLYSSINSLFSAINSLFSTIKKKNRMQVELPATEVKALNNSNFVL